MGDSPVWTADSETENDEPSAKGSGGKGKGSDEKGKSDKGKSWGVLPGSNAKGSGPSPSAKSSGDSSSVAKGKSKSRGEMTVEEKKVANLKNATKAKKSKTAANLAKSSKDAGWVVPRVADGQFNFPPGTPIVQNLSPGIEKECRRPFENMEADSGRRTAAEALLGS